MSWSVSAIGKAPAVKAEIQRQFNSGGKCVEPEESIRRAAVSLIDTAVSSIHESFAVKVTASGSQGMKNYQKPEEGTYNSLTIAVEVIHGFVEIKPSSPELIEQERGV